MIAVCRLLSIGVIVLVALDLSVLGTSWTCLYSRATLSSFSLLLPSEVYADWISEMTRAGMDYKNPEGVGAYTVFKNLCIIERNKSEGSRLPDKIGSPKVKPRSPRSPRTKTKSVHKVADTIEDNIGEMHIA